MSLEKLIKAASKLSESIGSGKEFTTKYVSQTLIKEAEANPQDIMIHMMRDAIVKKASTQNFISQKEIGSMYDSLINYCGGESSTSFRRNLSGFLPQALPEKKAERADASGIRGGSQHVKTLQEYDTGLEKLASEFAGVFSLEKKGSFSGYGNVTANKAKKFAKVQLESLGAYPKNITVTAENEHFILCRASFETQSLREVSIDVPVQISGGLPKLPEQFISDGSLEKMSKQNIMVALKAKEDGKRFDEKNKYASERQTDSIKIANVTAPKALDYLTNIEDNIIVSNSKFSNNQVESARRVLASELKSAGISGQIKVAGVMDRGILFESKIGNTHLEFPIEFSGGRAMLPSAFLFDNKKYNFTSSNLRKMAMSQGIKKEASVSLRKEAYDQMSYHQLMNEMISSVGSKEFKGAEDALSAIQTRFDDQKVVHAVHKYASLLKSVGMDEERESLIKTAVQRGDLIRTPTSLDLYSPKYGLPLSKLAFDESGNLIPVSRMNQIKNQKDSETLGISSYQIKLT